MKTLKLKNTPYTVKKNFGQILRQMTRLQLVEHIASYIIEIEKELCRQHGCDFRYPDENNSIVLDAFFISHEDFIYRVEVTDPMSETTATEDRVLGRITLDVGGLICMFSKGDKEYSLETEITELDTDTLFRLCDHLDNSL